MPIEMLFDHECDIYKCNKKQSAKGYGLPSGEEYDYPKNPDLVDIPCHFKSAESITISKNSPALSLSGDIILKLPIGTDIKQNDRVLDKRTNIMYVAYTPVPVRGNHLKVKLKVDDVLR